MHTPALDDGEVYGAGTNMYGQLYACGATAVPEGAAVTTALVPTGAARAARLLGAPRDARVTQLAAGADHSVAVFAEQHVLLWGREDAGQCGRLRDEPAAAASPFFGRARRRRRGESEVEANLWRAPSRVSNVGGGVQPRRWCSPTAPVGVAGRRGQLCAERVQSSPCAALSRGEAAAGGGGEVGGAARAAAAGWAGGGGRPARCPRRRGGGGPHACARGARRTARRRLGARTARLKRMGLSRLSRNGPMAYDVPTPRTVQPPPAHVRFETVAAATTSA